MLSELIMTAELGYAAGFTASSLGKPEVYIPGYGPVHYGPGSYIPNSIYANVGRCLTGEAVFHEQEILCNIAGESRPPSQLRKTCSIQNSTFLEKYINRNPKIPVEDQWRFWLLFVDATHLTFRRFGNYGTTTAEALNYGSRLPSPASMISGREEIPSTRWLACR